MSKEKKSLNINLMLLLLGRMISDAGTSIQMVIMPLYIIDVGGSAATVGLFSFLTLVPVLVVYPFAGVFGDRMNRKKIMMFTDYASALVIIGLAVSAYYGNMSLALLLSVQVIVSLLNGIFDPATKGMLPQLVTKDELSRANSTLAAIRMLSVLLGSVIGAVLYASMEVNVLFLINGISFLLSGFCALMIRYKHVERDSAVGIEGLITDLSEGIKFILVNKIIRKLCTFFLVIYAIIQPIFSVALPLFFRSSLEYSDTQYGYLQMGIIFGALLGSILVGVLFGKEKEIKKSLVIGCSLIMIAMLAFAVLLSPQSLSVLGSDTIAYLALLAGTLLLLSVAVMFVNIPVQTFIQKETPNEYMSRVFSIVGMISKGGMPFGALIYGVILNKFSVHWTMAAATLLMMLISMVFMFSLLRTQEFK